jgi:hypothetical protein
MICRYLDEGVVWRFPYCGPLAEDSAAKLKKGQLNVCTVYGVLFYPLRLKFVQISRQFLSVVDNSKVWGI